MNKAELINRILKDISGEEKLAEIFKASAEAHMRKSFRTNRRRKRRRIRKRKFKNKLRRFKRRFKKWITRDRIKLEIFVDELKFVERAFSANRIYSSPGHRGNTTFIKKLFTRGFLGIHFRGLNLIIINVAGIYRCFENWEDKLPDIIAHEYLHSLIHSAGFHDGNKQEYIIHKMEFCVGQVRENRKRPHYKTCTCKDK